MGNMIGGAPCAIDFRRARQNTCDNGPGVAHTFQPTKRPANQRAAATRKTDGDAGQQRRREETYGEGQRRLASHRRPTADHRFPLGSRKVSGRRPTKRRRGEQGKQGWHLFCGWHLLSSGRGRA